MASPIAIWARIGAALVAGLGVIGIAGIAAAWILGRSEPRKWTWYQWANGLWSFWSIYPMFLSVAVKGNLSWWRSLLGKIPNRKLTIIASGGFWIMMLVAGHYYDPVATNLVLILGAPLTTNDHRKRTKIARIRRSPHHLETRAALARPLRRLQVLENTPPRPPPTSGTLIAPSSPWRLSQAPRARYKTPEGNVADRLKHR